MPQTASTMLPLGTFAPPFRLPDAVTGKTVSLDDFKNSPSLLVMFICNHCPFIKHVRDELARLGLDYHSKGVAIVAISSNDVENFPADSPDLMKREAADAGYTFPYLYDESQEVARAYDAACTPDFFVFDRSRKLVYRGQLDDSRPSKVVGRDIPVTGQDLRAALDAVLAGKNPTADQKPSLGCNIKWKPAMNP